MPKSTGEWTLEDVQGPYTMDFHRAFPKNVTKVMSARAFVVGELYGPKEWGESVVKLMNGEAVGALLALLIEVAGTGLPGAPLGILERLSVEYEGEIALRDAYLAKVRALFARIHAHKPGGS